MQPTLSLAVWMILIAAILPLVAVVPAKARPDYDNRNPRAQYATRTGLAARALAAHTNSLEAFPFFAAAVIVAILFGAPRAWVDGLAVLFVLLRIGYIAAYWGDRHLIRSIVWAAGFFTCVGLFLTPLFR